MTCVVDLANLQDLCVGGGCRLEREVSKKVTIFPLSRQCIKVRTSPVNWNALDARKPFESRARQEFSVHSSIMIAALVALEKASLSVLSHAVARSFSSPAQ